MRKKLTVIVISILVACGLIAVAVAGSSTSPSPKATATFPFHRHHHPTPTTTTTAPPTTTTTTTTKPPVATGIYRGVGLTGAPADCVDIATLKLTWYYNWGTGTSCNSNGVPFVPMQWGSFSTLPKLTGQYLLTFNEPDNSSQSDLSVAQALALWPKLEATGLQLSTPAVTESSGGSAWLASFMAGVKADGFTVNFEAAHWYGNCNSPSSLISYLNQMHSLYNLPIWLTEFSCLNGSVALNTSFAQAVGPLLAQLPYLQRVAWFTNRSYPNGYQNVGLVGSTGALTSVGTAFVGWPNP